MKFFKTEELANEYRVSERTVQRWIKWAKSGKLHLELYSTGKRSFIIDTPENELVIKQLLSSNKKYKNKIGLQIIEPKKEFYELFNESQIIDIINNLEIFRELPHKYCYIDSGAAYWNAYINKVADGKQPVAVKSTLELLKFDQEYLSSLIKDYESINVVDLGPGNGRALKEFLEFIILENKLNKYIGIDFSSDVLKITEENLKSWFGKSFPFEGHLRDITRDSFQELLFKNTHLPNNEKAYSKNLVFFLGSTIENERSYDRTLSNIISSLGKDDIFVLGQRLDTKRARTYISFQSKGNQEYSDVEKLILNLVNFLNIPQHFYEVERFYSEKERARIIRIKFNTDIELRVETSNLKKCLKINNKESVIIWRQNHHTGREVMNMMSDIGFDVLRTTVSLDREQILVSSKIKSITD